MFRTFVCACAAVMILLPGDGFAADPPAQHLGRYQPQEDLKVFAPRDIGVDTEQVRHRGYWPNYHYGFRPYYGGFSYGYPTHYYTPRFYSYYTPQFVVPSYRYYSSYSFYQPGGYCGINGNGSSGVVLNLSFRPNLLREPEPARAMPSPIDPGTFRYDGGPSNPVPTPEAKPMPQPEPPAILAPRPMDNVLKIAFRPNVESKPEPLRYKAYGEK